MIGHANLCMRADGIRPYELICAHEGASPRPTVGFARSYVVIMRCDAGIAPYIVVIKTDTPKSGRMISAPTGQYLLRSYGGSKPPPYDWICTVLCSGYACTSGVTI